MAVTVYNNTNIRGAVKTVKKTIGGVGVAGCDFNFATAANQTEQSIDLGELLPAKSKLLDVLTFTDNVFTGAITLVAKIGTASGGEEIMESTTIYAANAVTPSSGGIIAAVPSASAANIFLSATPGANWSLVTAGKVSVYVSYIDVTNA
jgi:hypothetical protein